MSIYGMNYVALVELFEDDVFIFHYAPRSVAWHEGNRLDEVHIPHDVMDPS